MAKKFDTAKAIGDFTSDYVPPSGATLSSPEFSASQSKKRSDLAVQRASDLNKAVDAIVKKTGRSRTDVVNSLIGLAKDVKKWQPARRQAENTALPGGFQRVRRAVGRVSGPLPKSVRPPSPPSPRSVLKSLGRVIGR